MPVLENERWELFAQSLAKGETATKAYELAGFRPSRSNAARLRANESVRARVEELQCSAARTTEVSIQTLIRELDDAIDVARTKGQAQAMVSAAGMKAKLTGLMVERSQIEVSNGSLFGECTSLDELCRRMADARLDALTNARWLPISDQDRRHLADINARWFAEMQAFVDEVNARPLIYTRKIEPHKGVAQRVITKGKDEV